MPNFRKKMLIPPAYQFYKWASSDVSDSPALNPKVVTDLYWGRDFDHVEIPFKLTRDNVPAINGYFGSVRVGNGAGINLYQPVLGEFRTVSGWQYKTFSTIPEVDKLYVYKADFATQKVFLNDEEVSVNTSADSSSLFTLFAVKNNNAEYCIIGETKLSLSGVLVADLVPARHFGETGFYDKIRDVWYPASSYYSPTYPLYLFND